MWAAIIGVLGRILAVILGRWITRGDAGKDAADKVVAEVEREDRRKANEIRDRVDGARLGGGLQSKPTDTRGYRD